MKPDPIALHGGGGAAGASSPSTASSLRQTVPSHADEMDTPPPYSSVDAAPASARSSSESSVSAGEAVPLRQQSASRRHDGAYAAPPPMTGHGARPVGRPRGYARQAAMAAAPRYSSATFDPDSYAGKAGCCFSETGGGWCSERGGCCCSSDGGHWCSESEGCCCSSGGGHWCSGSGGCCCSENHGAWCSSNHGCCFSDNGGAWCSDNGGAWCSDGSVSLSPSSLSSNLLLSLVCLQRVSSGY